MVRERKNQLGVSNLSARIENSSFGSGSTIKTNELPTNTPSPSTHTKVMKSLTRSLIAPDDYQETHQKSKSHHAKQTATWKPAPIYQRDFKTDHTDSFGDPGIPGPPALQPKSTYQLAEERVQSKEEKGALDNLCKLIRTTYGTVASMLRSFNKKNTDNFTLYEFNEYIKRNQLETYFPPEQQKLVFDFVEKKHNGIVPVKDFLKSVEEHEFHDHEMNKETQKIRDFLALHVVQRRAEEEELRRTQSLNTTLPPIDQELLEAKKQKGIQNEAEKIRKALGMNTYNLDIDHEEFNEVLDEVYFKKLPTNEMHRKYARFLHHSNLKLAQVPYYDIRSMELDRLKHRAAMIDRILEGADMKGRYLELSQSRANLLNHRVNNAFLSSVNSRDDLKNAVDVNNYDFDKYDDPDEFTTASTVTDEKKANNNDFEEIYNSDSNLDHTATKVLVRPRSSNFVEGTEPPPAAAITRSSSPAERFQEDKEKARDRLGLSKSLPNLSLSARPSPLAALDLSPLGPPLLQKPKIRDLSGAAATTKDPSRNPINLENSLINNAGTAPVAGGKGGPQPSHDYEETSIINASQKHGVFLSSPLKSFEKDFGSVKSAASVAISASSQQLSANTKGSAISSPSKKSKLISELLQPQEGALKEADFYTAVYDESSSMGRMKDPSKIVRIEKIDPNVYASKGKRILSRGPTDWTRVGIGGDNSQSGDSSQGPFQSTYSSFYPPLIYEPSQPVTRNLVSDAEIAFRKKEFIRNQRYQRTQANLEITRQRIEAEQLEKQIRALRRDASRIEDSIHYKTAVILNDLYAFKQQPLQRMAKRQNIHLSDRMWGGSQEKQTVVLVKENRDFLTTYSSSFLKDSLDEQTRPGDQGDGKADNLDHSAST